MADPIKESIDFMRAEFLALAFMGSLFALSLWPQSSRNKALVKVFVGVGISCSSTPAIIWVTKVYVPSFPDEGLYWVGCAMFFWIGFLSSQIARSLAEGIKRLPKAKLPWGEQ